MEKIPTIRLVFDRKHQATKSGIRNASKGLVQIEVLHQRKRKYISTGVKLYADQWRQNAELHVVGSAYAKQYNDTISHAMRSVMDMVNKQAAQGTIDLSAISYEADGVISVGDYGDKVIRLEGKAPSTKDNVGVIMRKIHRFERFSDIRKVTRSDIEAFYMAQGMRPTSLSNIVSVVRRIFAAAFLDNVIPSDPSAMVKVTSGKSRERVRLTDEEVYAIAAAELPERLHVSRDIFLFQCYTGMAFIDCVTLAPEMLQSENGHTFIVRTRQKTGTRYRTMLLKPAAAIVGRLGVPLPIPIKRTYLRQLKEIAELAGIKKHVTSHVGRHTFATWALSHGTPIEIVSKMLGHTNIKTTQIYAKILAKDVDALFERLDKLF